MQPKPKTLDIYRITGKTGTYSPGVRYGTKIRARAIAQSAIDWNANRKRKLDIKIERVTVKVEDWEDVTSSFILGDYDG